MTRPPQLGDLRVNPHTFMSEMWNGHKWVDTPEPHMLQSAYVANSTVTGITSTNTTTKPILSPTERELIYDFMKENLRVAEYKDGNGKIESIELQMRSGPGYMWESVRREQIIRSKK